MKNNMVFDLGYYDGESTIKFLESGYKVIGIECNPSQWQYCSKLYKDRIAKKDLILINKAIYNKDGEIIPFYIHDEFPWWSSCLKKIPCRIRGEEVYEIPVETITLKTLIKTYGCPYFCKIDIEGYDAIAIKSLIGLDEIPLYIQLETECIGDEDPNNIDFLETLNLLKEAGYTKFVFLRGRNDQCVEIENLRYEDYETIKNKIIATRKTFDFSAPWDFWFDIVATY